MARTPPLSTFATVLFDLDGVLIETAPVHETACRWMFDGEVVAADAIAGKPRPDTYLAAAELVGIRTGRVVVVEDPVSGVQTPRAGGFGVDRLDQAGELRAVGADDVAADLSGLEV